MTTTDATDAPDATAGTATGLRPGRAETDRLAARVAVPADGRDKARVTSPLTGEVVGEVPVGTAADVAAAVAASRAVQGEWAAARPPPGRRAAALPRHGARRAGRAHGPDPGRERQGPGVGVRGDHGPGGHGPVLRPPGPRALRPHRRLSALPGLVSTREHHIPKGVVGIISPWNYPLVLAVSGALAALVVGNGIVIKPDSQTPFTALRAFELLEQAGLPAGLVQVVTGPGRTVGTAIIESSDYMMFTGSTATGRVVARQAGERLIGMSAELGGKRPMVVTDDVDLDRPSRAPVVRLVRQHGPAVSRSSGSTSPRRS